MILTSMDDDWTSVVGNFCKERKIWERLLQILGSDREYTWKSGRFYMVVVQEIMILVLEMWVVNPHIGRAMGEFHHRFARRITEKHTGRKANERQKYPLLEETVYEPVLEDMETYISRRKNTATNFITNMPILDLCLEAERRPEAWTEK